jgi:hypothetical protein
VVGWNKGILAVEAVIGEPVSASHFPVSRENTGKFSDFGLTIDEAPRLSAGNTIAYDRNSPAAEAGKICRRTGNFEGRNSERAGHFYGALNIRRRLAALCCMPLTSRRPSAQRDVNPVRRTSAASRGTTTGLAEVCFGSKADLVATNANVRFVPAADVGERFADRL